MTSSPKFRELLSADAIAQRVQSLAAELDVRLGGEPATLLCVMTGSILFCADLMRHVTSPVQLEPAAIRSYSGDATEPHAPEFRLWPEQNIAGEHVVIVEDILDTGQTISQLTERLNSMGAQSVTVCVLLRKRRDDLPDRCQADLVGFDIPDEFVVGYGLDHNGLHRNLPYIAIVEPMT